ncbi:alpha/beta hydrolase [Aspergillus saccharolyticus JOP 1030-1]|uniref:Alpha/beta-hydrolase n=1 Tax=Aspergillus saccharolyticus JOP 1030-1 TaxID=1450539 RepID=A0A318ZNH1_9EURO|nr:alpha/beta-hydrolase [Aspergillus saccharolyticus JOP 1030-1]PYH45993.1 alpha/beta-hydrolase [Aspergillus saccharolyticus JOP 1030-1]
MKSTQQPTLVICHGSYHTPAPYAPFIEQLNLHGFETYCPQRPTCDLRRLNVGDDLRHPDLDRPAPPGGYPSDTEDVQVILDLLERLITQEGKQVLLVAHSSGGWVATQAALPKYHVRPDASAHRAPGIIGIFYYSAFLVPVGESVSGWLTPPDGSFFVPEFARASKYGPKGLMAITDGAKYMFGELPRGEGERWSTTLTAQPLMTVELTNDAYSALPCAYLLLEKDLALGMAYQEAMLQAQNERLRRQGKKEFVVYRAATDHSPHLSWTMGLVNTIEDFVGRLRGGVSGVNTHI